MMTMAATTATIQSKPAAVERDLFSDGGHARSSSSAPSPTSPSVTKLSADRDDDAGKHENHNAHDVVSKRQKDLDLDLAAEYPLPPSEIVKDPAEKDLGLSSKSLGLDNFELIRTLGTG